MKNKMKKTNLSTVINLATKTLKIQKPLDILSEIKVARKSIHQSMGSKKNVKVPLVVNVPNIGGFLPIVPTINNARMAKEDMEEKNVTTGK